MPGQVTIDEPHPHIRRLTLSNEGRRNAMDAAMRDGLDVAMRDAVADPEAHAVILTGAHGDFCAGGDLAGLREMDPETLPERLAIAHRIVWTMRSARKPIVAAVPGAAAGGGAALMLACDEVILAHSARVGITFMRIGLLPDMGTLHLLARRIGRGPARRLLLDPDIIDAAACLRAGIADHLAPDDQIGSVAIERAVRLASHPPECWADTKAALETLPDDLHAVFALELDQQTRRLAHAEFREGSAAFLEKRPPRFRP